MATLEIKIVYVPRLYMIGQNAWHSLSNGDFNSSSPDAFYVYGETEDGNYWIGQWIDPEKNKNYFHIYFKKSETRKMSKEEKKEYEEKIKEYEEKLPYTILGKFLSQKVFFKRENSSAVEMHFRISEHENNRRANPYNA